MSYNTSASARRIAKAGVVVVAALGFTLASSSRGPLATTADTRSSNDVAVEGAWGSSASADPRPLAPQGISAGAVVPRVEAPAPRVPAGTGAGPEAGVATAPAETAPTRERNPVVRTSEADGGAIVGLLMRIGGWASGPVIDTIAPRTVQTTPSADQSFTLPTAITVSGTGTDNLAVASVKVAVFDKVAGKWLRSDSNWSGGAASWFDATLVAPNTRSSAWTWTWTTPVPGDFVITSRTVDKVGNTDATRPAATVHVNPPPGTNVPATPKNLAATPQSTPPRVVLTWSAETQGSGVTGYEVQRDGQVVASPLDPGWTDTSVVVDLDYSYTVRARDGAGNWSALTAPVSVRVGSRTVGTWTFGASGLDGAGFQNVVALDPASSGAVLSGADVAGVHRSSNWGLEWRQANSGLDSLSRLKVAAFAWSRTQPGVVYAATGAKGAGGGLLRSSDGGVSWAVVSTVPQFSGGNNSGLGGLPATHPRSTGNLLVLDEARGLLYAATFDDGVMRSADGGATWTTLGLAGKYLRSIVADPANPDVLYVAAYNDGVYKTTTASGAAAFAKLSASPTSTEELAFVGNSLFAAAGSAGVFRSNDAGVGWVGLGGPRTDGPVWISVTGYVDAGGRTVVLAGCDKPAKASKVGANQMFASVMRSLDAGATWSSLTDDPAKVHYETGDASGPRWWLASAQPYMMIDKGSFTAAQIVVDATGTNVYVAGRSGVWRSPDGGANWWPVVRGMGVTINRDVVADPNVSGRVYVGNTDWLLLWSADGGRTITQNRPPTGAETFGVALDTTTTPSAVTVAVGDRDTNSAGEVYSNVDPASTTAWVSEGLAASTGGKRPLAIAVGHPGGQRVLLAAVEDGGVWRKSGTSWTRVSTSAMGAQTTDSAGFAWQEGSSTVFLYDRESGVWRSNDAGATWTMIWSKPSATEMTGYVALDPKVAGRLWVAARDGLYRIEGAASGSVDAASLLPIELGALVNPSEISFDPGGALVTLSGGHVYRSVDAGPLQDVSDPSVTSAGRFVFGTSIGPDGRLYLALNGDGVLVGTPSAPTG